MLRSDKVLAMNLLTLSILFVTLAGSFAQNLETSCVMPEDIPTSRLGRLHHLCESNQNHYFAIETRGDFYCIFYSVFGIALFEAETKFEIKVNGKWSYEQVG